MHPKSVYLWNPRTTSARFWRRREKADLKHFRATQSWGHDKIRFQQTIFTRTVLDRAASLKPDTRKERQPSPLSKAGCAKIFGFQIARTMKSADGSDMCQQISLSSVPQNRRIQTSPTTATSQESTELFSTTNPRKSQWVKTSTSELRMLWKWSQVLTAWKTLSRMIRTTSTRLLLMSSAEYEQRLLVLEAIRTKKRPWKVRG